MSYQEFQQRIREEEDRLHQDAIPAVQKHDRKVMLNRNRGDFLAEIVRRNDWRLNDQDIWGVGAELPTKELFDPIQRLVILAGADTPTINYMFVTFPGVLGEPKHAFRLSWSVGNHEEMDTTRRGPIQGLQLDPLKGLDNSYLGLTAHTFTGNLIPNITRLSEYSSAQEIAASLRNEELHRSLDPRYSAYTLRLWGALLATGERAAAQKMAAL